MVPSGLVLLNVFEETCDNLHEEDLVRLELVLAARLRDLVTATVLREAVVYGCREVVSGAPQAILAAEVLVDGRLGMIDRLRWGPPSAVPKELGDFLPGNLWGEKCLVTTMPTD